MTQHSLRSDPRPWRELLVGVPFQERAPRADGRSPVAAEAVRGVLRGAGFGEWAARAHDGVTVVVNDGHRFTDTRAFLDVALPMLEDACGSALPLRALVAAGTHRSTDEERGAHEVKIFGRWRDRFAEVAWHDARDDARLERVGDVRLHSWMAERSSYLACGSAEPHYFAGVTGAHKTLTVGVMAADSIEANHALAMLPEASGLRLEGNPVYEGIARAVDGLAATGARLFALNQVLVGGAVVECTAGDPIESLRRALPAVKACFADTVPAPVDLLIAHVGPPLDRDLYQADKGIKNTEAAVRDGGVLIVEAACSHGVGIDHFLNTLGEAPSYAAACELVARRGYRLGDHKAVRLRHLSDTRGVRLAIVSGGLDSDLESTLGMRVFRDRAAAATWAAEQFDGAPGSAVEVHDAGNLTLTVG